MAITLMALGRREYPVGKLCRSIHSNPIRGGSTRFMAMCGNGQKTVGTTTTLERPRMARLGYPAVVVTVSFAGAPGTSIHGSSARPSASGTPPTAGTTSSGSVSGGRFPLESPLITRQQHRRYGPTGSEQGILVFRQHTHREVLGEFWQTVGCPMSQLDQ